jgi:endonuclease
MQKPKRFLIVTKGQTGNIELHKMKEWLRQHPAEIPPGLTPDHNNSHQLRDGLKRKGWTVNETDEEVRILRPEIAEDATTVSVLGESAEEETTLDPEEQFEFALESHLRDFIARNLATLPIRNRRLKLFMDSSNRRGVEYPTDVGPIDILATDEQGNFFVFELKLSRGPDRAMGQLLRYMGWVKRALAGQHEVHGIIVAKSMDEKLRYASLPVPNVSLLEYEVNFQLRAADLSDTQA